MKLLVAIIFSTIAILSAATKNSVTCVEKAKVDHVQVLNSLESVIQSSNDQNENYQGPLKASSDCQICHIGHCDFTVATKFNFAIVLMPTELNFVTSSFDVFDFHSGLFRPPIA